MDEDLFKVPIKKSTGVHDFRIDGDPRWVAKNDAVDVTIAQDGLAQLRQAAGNEQPGQFRVWLVLVNVVVASVLGLVIWRKKSTHQVE